MRMELTEKEKKAVEKISLADSSKIILCASCCRELPQYHYDPKIPTALQYFYCDDCAEEEVEG